MPDTISQEASTPDKVTVTLEVNPQVYAAFLRKAQQADMDIGTFLSSTLTLVLGCRVFDEKYAKSPSLFAQGATPEHNQC